VIGTLVRTLLVGAVLCLTAFAAGWVLAANDRKIEREDRR
jgi:hypothetical protein